MPPGRQEREQQTARRQPHQETTEGDRAAAERAAVRERRPADPRKPAGFRPKGFLQLAHRKLLTLLGGPFDLVSRVSKVGYGGF